MLISEVQFPCPLLDPPQIRTLCVCVRNSALPLTHSFILLYSHGKKKKFVHCFALVVISTTSIQICYVYSYCGVVVSQAGFSNVIVHSVWKAIDFLLNSEVTKEQICGRSKVTKTNFDCNSWRRKRNSE